MEQNRRFVAAESILGGIRVRKLRLYYVLLIIVTVAGVGIWAMSAVRDEDGSVKRQSNVEAGDQAGEEAAAQAASRKARQPAPLLTPDYDVDVRRGIVYASKMNESETEKPLMLDLYLPANDNSTGRPVFVFIHGGGYSSGTRQDGEAYAVALAQRGYAVAAVDYRLKRNPFIDFTRTLSEAYEDIDDALNWIAANAEANGLDAGQVAIGGDSAGGHLAMNYVNKYLDRNPAWKGSIFAIVDIYGGELDQSVHDLLPPTLIIHGTIDELVPYAQSLALRQELKRRGIYQTMLTLEDVGHDYKNDKYFGEIVETTAHFLWNVRDVRGIDSLPEVAGIEAVSGDSFELPLPKVYQGEADDAADVQLPTGWTYERLEVSKLHVRIPAGLERGNRSIIVSRREVPERETAGGRFAVNVRVLDPLEPKFETYYDAERRAIRTRLSITNRSASPFGGALRLQYETERSSPGEFTANVEKLAPGGSEELIVPGLAQGQRSLEGLDSTGRLVQRTEDIFHAIVAHRISAPMKIDGSLEEWNGQAQYNVSKVVMDGWNGARDESASGYISWDADNLYIALDVTDDTHAQSSQGEAIWSGDSVQLAIGFADGDGGAPVEYSELGVALDDAGGLSHWRWIAPSGYNPGDSIRLRKAVNRTEGHTVYEMALPWYELTRDVEAVKQGTKLKFSLLISDNDGSGRKGWIEYNGGIGTAKDIHAFGDVFLGE